MPGPDFFQTPMGRKFYESDAPRIAKALDRLALAQERIAAAMEAKLAGEFDSLRQVGGAICPTCKGEIRIGHDGVPVCRIGHSS